MAISLMLKEVIRRPRMIRLMLKDRVPLLQDIVHMPKVTTQELPARIRMLKEIIRRRQIIRAMLRDQIPIPLEAVLMQKVAILMQMEVVLMQKVLDVMP